ncbi:MAG: hypothetical protein PHN75_09775 [Syntrophales bacterium]|nr:hypothetical protein [Syntrophales bacterium]
MKTFLKDKKNVVIALLTALAAIGTFHAGWRFALWAAAGVFVCAILDALVNRIIFKKTIVPKSAIISGFIVSGILDHYQPWYILLVFSSLPVFSKHLIKFKGKHIFNPAAFSLFFATLFKIPLTWTIESNVILTVIIGIYLTITFKKTFHVMGFLIAFTILSIIAKTNSLALISWFFVFVMLIEPKTSGFGRVRGFIFGSIAGIVSFLMYRFYPAYDFWVVSLIVANCYIPISSRLAVSAGPKGAKEAR